MARKSFTKERLKAALSRSFETRTPKEQKRNTDFIKSFSPGGAGRLRSILKRGSFKIKGQKKRVPFRRVPTQFFENKIKGTLSKSRRNRERNV